MPEITAELDTPEWWAQMAALRDEILARLDYLGEAYEWAEGVVAIPAWGWACLAWGRRSLFDRTVARMVELSALTPKFKEMFAEALQDAVEWQERDIRRLRRRLVKR